MERLTDKPFFPILFTILIWGFSLIFRVAYLDSTPPVNNVAHLFLLKTMDIWNKEGPAESCFTMKHTYGNSGDKFITYYKRFTDDSGNNYYVSHPPLTQFLTWIFTGFGSFRANNTFLMWLAMLFHLTGAIFLIKIIKLIYNSNSFSKAAQIIAGTLYVFHPVVLYMFTFHFFAESVGQLMFIIMMYALASITMKATSISKYGIILLFITSFLFSLSEWLGVVFAVSFLLSVFLSKKATAFQLRSTAIAMIAGSAAAVFVFFLLHISLQDTETFIRALGIRFLERSGFFGKEYTDMGYAYSNPHSYSLLLKQIFELMRGVGFILFALVIVYFRKRKSILKAYDPMVKTIIISAFLACLLYLIILFSASVTHYIYSAKWVIPIILIVAITVPELHLHTESTFKKITSYIFVIICVFWSIYIFRQKAEHLIRADQHLKNYASMIRNNSETDESVFVAPFESRNPETTVIWLSYSSGRNIAVAENQQEICDFLKMKGGKFVYYRFEQHKLQAQHGECVNP